jgi:hypothetical protein
VIAAIEPPQPTIDAHGGLRRVGAMPKLQRQGRLNPPYGLRLPFGQNSLRTGKITGNVFISPIHEAAPN